MRKQPGNGLSAEWPQGKSQWKEGMDENLRLLSMAVQLVVASSTRPFPPPEPVQDGTVVINPANGLLMGYTEGEWVSPEIAPKPGWIGWDMELNSFIVFGNNGWNPAPWIVGAPSDGHPYVYKDGQWARQDYFISAFIPQITASAQLLASFVMPAAVTLPVGAPNFVARVQTAAPNDVVLTMRRFSGNSYFDVGTITFASGQTNGTFTVTSAANFAKGDSLRIFGPNPMTGVPEGIEVLFQLAL